MKSLLLTAGLSAITLAASAAAQPAALGREVRVVVPTRNVDFSDPAQMSSLHRRLSIAAAKACDERVPRTIGLPRYDRVCAKDALDRVVASANSPQLAAVHGGRTIDAPQMQRAAR